MTPDAGALWRVCAEYGVKRCSPHRPHPRREEGRSRRAADKQYDLNRLQTIFSAGERLDAPTETWLSEHSGKRGGSLVADRDRLGDHRKPARREPMTIKPGSSPKPYRLQRADSG